MNPIPCDTCGALIAPDVQSRSMHRQDHQDARELWQQVQELSQKVAALEAWANDSR